jgi:ribosomal peptide maturation radical SAM protein 1
MKVLLVTMPWHSLSYPSLALGILKKKAALEAPHVVVDDCYASLRFAEYVFGLHPDPHWPVLYNNLSDTVFTGIGDWIFSSALNEAASWNAGEMERTLRANGLDVEFVNWLHRTTPRFIEAFATDVTSQGYGLVAFTSTFMQNAASIAAAREIKKRSPGTRIAMGGANCDAVQGIALHRNFPWVDFVVRGEGERAFVQLLGALQGERDFATIDGLCWRDGATTVVNRDTGLLPVSEIAEPDFHAYFDSLEASPLRQYIKPQLVLEAARGCWWGEKHHCTFCGLNGTGMKFRSKSPHAVWAEIANAVTAHQNLDVMMVDNIMDVRYFKTLLPMIEESDWDLRLHYEVKANLSPDDVAALKRAKVEHIQPGIESLSSRVLTLMNKGVSGGQNIALLREGMNQNLTVSWNYLYGFPGEADEDYAVITEQMPNLYHLQPPTGAQRLAVERFSPLFNDPELGVRTKTPASFYRHIYDLPEAELNELVFLFDAPPAGLQHEAEKALRDAVAEWRRAHNDSTLHLYDLGGSLMIDDRRAGREPQVFVFDEPFEVAGYELLMKSLSATALHRLLEKRSLDVGTERLERWLEFLCRAGLVFVDGDRYTALATVNNPANIRFNLEVA